MRVFICSLLLSISAISGQNIPDFRCSTENGSPNPDFIVEYYIADTNTIKTHEDCATNSASNNPQRVTNRLQLLTTVGQNDLCIKFSNCEPSYLLLDGRADNCVNGCCEWYAPFEETIPFPYQWADLPVGGNCNQVSGGQVVDRKPVLLMGKENTPVTICAKSLEKPSQGFVETSGTLVDCASGCCGMKRNIPAEPRRLN